MRRIRTEPVAIGYRGVTLNGVRQITTRELSALRRIVKCAEEAESWCYVHQNDTALTKMLALNKALRQFDKMRP